MFNKTDLKLISALENDGRASYAQLAKSTGVSVNTVSKRMGSLLSNGVLTVNAIPNPYKMGYRAYAVVGMDVSVDKIEKVCQRLRDNLSVNFIATSFGRFNLIIIVYSSSWNSLHDFISSELSGRGDIDEIEVFFVDKVRKRYYGFSPVEYNEGTDEEIDAIDKNIIEELAIDGRTSCKSLAEKYGISLSSVSKRIARLTEENIIKVQAIINPTKVGYRSDAFIFIRAAHAEIENICTSLESINEVITILTLSNGYDIYAGIIANTSETLYKLIKSKVETLPGITHLDILIRGILIKRYYGTIHVDSDLLKQIGNKTFNWGDLTPLITPSK